MTTDKLCSTQSWQAEFDELLSEARQSLDAVWRDAAVGRRVYLYFLPSASNARGGLRLACECPDDNDWQVLEQPIRMNTDVRGIMAQVAQLAVSLPVLTRR